MDPDRWRQVDRILQGALEQEPARRAAFLDTACGPDAGLRREVEGLIAAHEQAGSFMESPAAGGEPPSGVHAGETLGTYRLEALIGRGGMGEVYRAHDTRLGREVAIKVLPASFAGSADRTRRFEREARLLAALNHPNIAAIYGLEEHNSTRFLVLELVGGDTLEDRLKHGAIPVEESLTLASQIAEALEAAHEKGVVHRDLKPANIKITPDGKVKVLDFGLAKALVGDAGGVNLSDSPTLSLSATREGVLLGTAAYMAPEQATGKPVDRRADMWAFGVVLYEMVTGTRLFPGDSVAEILASVIGGTADLERVPARIRPIIEKCLRREPRRRWQWAGDIRLAIEEAGEAGEGAVPGAEPRPVPARGWSGRIGWGIAAALLVVSATLAILRPGPAPVEIPPYRFSVPVPEELSGNETFFRLSPDGRYLAMSAFVAETESRLWVRPLDSDEAAPLAGTEGAAGLFWSPDSTRIGFFAGGTMKTVSVSGGPVSQIADYGGQFVAWNPDGAIVFLSQGQLYGVDPERGIPATELLTVEWADQTIVREPSFLPDGGRFLYTEDSNIETAGIRVGSLDSTESIGLLPNVSTSVYVPPTAFSESGYLLFRRGTTLVAQPFDPGRLELTGPVFNVVDQVRNRNGTPPIVFFSASANGTLAYQTARDAQLAWHDRDGRVMERLGPPGTYATFRLSADGTRVAMQQPQIVGTDVTSDVWVLDVERNIPERWTTATDADLVPVWSPDGKYLAFASNRLGPFDVYVTSAPSSEELLVDLTTSGGWPTDWSRDGRWILYQSGGIWSVPVIDGQPNGDSALYHIPARQGTFSPDGNWVAFTSNESGSDQVYVDSFPAPGASPITVSGPGGSAPVWRDDGSELFYIDANGMLVAVPVTYTPAIDFGLAEPLFAAPSTVGRHPYEIADDGQRFLFAIAANPDTDTITVSRPWMNGLDGFEPVP